MKKLVIIFLLLSAALYTYGQKMKVAIVNVKESGIAEWQILDQNYIQVFNGNESLPGDTTFVSLEADRHYILQLSVMSITRTDTILCEVVVGGEPIIKVNSSSPPGDYFYPFFTGTRAESSKIIGGSAVSIAQYPWQIFLISGPYQCGGSIINKNWVMTAAHCVNGIPPTSIVIKAGTSNPYSSGTVYDVSEVHVHERYSSTALENDIALLRVSTPITCTYCTPVKLITPDIASEGATDPGVMTTISGWGLTSVTPETRPSILQAAQVPIVSIETVRSVWPSVPSTDLMAGYFNGNKDACSGDSGGPMVVPYMGESRQAGIVSWGSKNCDTYGGYSKVSAFEAWIKGIAGDLFISPSIPMGDSVVCPSTLSSNYTTGAVAGATSYEWNLYPSAAGSLTPGGTSATVVWNKGYIGQVKVRVRAITGGSYTEWGTRTAYSGVETKLLTQPSDTAICEGNSLSLFIVAEGSFNVFDWYKDGSLYRENGGEQLYFYEALPSWSGLYSCNVTGVCGSFSITPFNVNVYPLTRINSVTGDVYANFGDSISLGVSATGHNLLYKWLLNDKIYAGGDSSTLTMRDVDARNIGLYKSVVTGTCGILTSNSIYVYVRGKEASSSPNPSVWPTVVTDEVNVAYSTNEKYDVSIFNMSGKAILNSTGLQYKSTFNLIRFPKGIYFLEVKGTTIRKSFKIFRQ